LTLPSNPWTGADVKAIPTAGGRTASIQAYQLVLHRGALHPEFFQIEGRRQIRHGEYDFEAWVFRGGHSARFELDGICITETVSTSVGHLPERGHVTTFPCAGEKDHEEEFSERVVYMTSIQTETLSPHLYASTYNEMLEHGRSPGCLMTLWDEPQEPKNLSVVDMQRFLDEVHVQSYHLRSDCGLVLRTQSIFQIKQPE